ncbi:ABC transporter ATP-binding protein [Chachezhania sediminis]|uniref:ABC transporter ATP-binding protein n=1 Tax=Chachezhania sediminis TaxID=2599291 RepID=UPI00131E5654|nr:ABC transporter ATP-binding protein [Chachezhania sediminis]
MTLLTLEDLTVRRGPCPVVEGASLSVAGGEVVGLVGPNGAGKTSLMRATLGLLPHDGRSSLAELPPRARARQVAWLPQAREIAWPVTVERLIALGRVPHGRRAGPADAQIIDAAIARMDLDAYRYRTATHLSGGEQARVLLARALAQGTPLLIADEPIAGLDPAHQIATMEVFAGLATEGVGTVVSIHDLGLAARFCTRLVLMDRGRIVADGRPLEVLTPERLADVFGITAWAADTPEGPVLQPMTLSRRPR